MNIRTPAGAICVFFTLALGGCGADVLRDAALPPASDPSVRVAKARYTPVMAGYQHYQPVAPANWQELNRRVAPPGAFPPDQTSPVRRERRP